MYLVLHPERVECITTTGRIVLIILNGKQIKSKHNETNIN